MTPRSTATRTVLVVAPSFQPWDLGEYLAGALLEVLESLNRKTPVRGAGEREDRFACVHCSDE